MERLLDIIVIRKNEIGTAAEQKACDSLIESYSKKKGFSVVEGEQKVTIYKTVKE